MAHNIAIVNGAAQAWYADKPAWHGLGTVTEGTRTAAGVRKAIPVFRQPVELLPVAVQIGGRWVEQPDFRATVRKGEKQAMSTGLTEDYSAFQDSDGLALMEAVVNASRRSSFVTAGALGKRAERSFASIDLSRVTGLRIKRDPSQIETHLFGTWSHDGTAAARFGLTTNRVECQNMLNAALAHAEGKGLLVSIRHTGDMATHVAEAQRVLGFAEREVKRFVETMNALVDIPLPTNGKLTRWLGDFLENLIPNVDDPEAKRASASREQSREVIAAITRNSKSLEGVPMSPYRVLQAVAEYADHYRPLRLGDAQPEAIAERRFRSIYEGPAADLKARAAELLRQEFLVPVAASVN